MPNDTFAESLWRRGWRDTRAIWTSWPFFVLDGVVGVLTGGLTMWYWGLAIVAFGMVCAWMGATVRAPYNQRNEARAKLLEIPGATPNAPKLAHAELYLNYFKHEFGVANGTPILSIEAELYPTGPMRIEAVELCLVGKRIPSLDWKVQEVSPSVWLTSSDQFNIPPGISPGEHDAELVAFANGEWWRSHPFTITFPEVNS